jgi:pimeloyl-ACP methyl ester carboxylesterase
MMSRSIPTRLLLALGALALTAGPVSAALITPAGAPDDHFMCYRVRSSKVSICAAGSAAEGSTCASDADCGGTPGTCVRNKFAKTEVSLKDGFDTGAAVIHRVLKPLALCAPADKEGEGIVDPTTHLVSYKIKHGKGQPKHERRTGLQVMNQFGLFTVDTIKEDRLLVPAAKDLNVAVPAPDNSSNNVDHYKCYKVKVSKSGPKFQNIDGVSIADQFESSLYDLTKPKHLCRPVDKNGEGMKNPLGQLLCYKPKLESGQPKHTRRLEVHTNDQLGPNVFDTVKQREFCVPSVALENTAGCDVLNGAECMLPWPSTALMVDDPSTDTGKRLNLPEAGMPDVLGPPIDVARFNIRDGFSPMAQILMHFPQGVDLVQSDASRLLPAGCCGQPVGPPWIDTRTYTDRSLQSDSPTLLFDADTGEQILHFVEPDAHAEGNPARQALIMRPGISLKPNHRYIVAMRNLKTAAGDDVVPEGAFLALRDDIPTSLPDIENRRQYFEDDIFGPLTSFGVDRSTLVLAFDFVTASDHQLTHQILTMRDAAYDWLDTVEASPMTVPFTVDKVTENDCMVPGTIVWRLIQGTYQSPFFLEGAQEFTTSSAQYMNVDSTDTPVQNGFMDADYTISIPCSALDVMGPINYPIVLGHGLFGTGADFVEQIPDAVGSQLDWNFIAGATDWRGLAEPDLTWVATQTIGIGTSKLDQFEALPDRLAQGMLNTLVLSRMMKLGIFNRDAAFQKPDTSGVLPGSSEDEFYFGASLGGIMGTWFAALTPDIQRFVLDVPAVNFSCLLQRSFAFSPFEGLLDNTGLDDPLEVLVGLGLMHEVWVSAEPAGSVLHVMSDRLPGSGTFTPHILMTAAWLDKLVSNQCTEIEVRSLGLPNLAGASLQSNLVDIPDVAGPLDSAYLMWDTGSFDVLDPAYDPYIPPLANLVPDDSCDPHSKRPYIPDSFDQLVAFMQPGGVITNTCTGLCDAGDPSEIPHGDATPCDPLN